MAIVINGSGTVTDISVGGLPDGIVDDGTLATDSVTAAKLKDDAIASGDLPTGSVIATYTDVVTSEVVTNSDSHVDSGLSITLTPKSTSSKFLIRIDAKTKLDNTNENAGQDWKLLRDSTQIANTTHMNYWNRLDYSDDYYPPLVIAHVDSPSTTSSITYKLQLRNYNGNSASWVFAESGGGNQYALMTIMEIAG